MSWKSQSVSMPMTSAGIVGIAANEQLAGIQIDPRVVILATLVFVGVVKIASMLVMG
ncbi:MAG: preprotein translocase subunit Sec61beta [Candidatus Micrarchaeota archaeon]